MKNKPIIFTTAIVFVLLASIISFKVISDDQSAQSTQTEPSAVTTTKVQLSEKVVPSEDENNESGLNLIPSIVEDGSSTKETSLIRADAKKSKSHVINGKTVSLNYSKTVTSQGGHQTDIYVDQYDNEFKFTLKGVYLGKNISDETFLTQTDPYTGDAPEITELTEDVAKKIAVLVAKEQLGELFDLVEFDKISKDELSQCYYVYFDQKLGENGFIHGINCFVTVFPDGTVGDCRMVYYEDLVDFDSSLLENISEQALYDDAGKQAADHYGEYFDGYEILKTNLKNDGEKYYIQVVVGVKLNFPGKGTVSDAIPIRYDFK